MATPSFMLLMQNPWHSLWIFVSPLYSHIQSVIRAYWLYFQILYQKPNYLLLPPLLPLWTKVWLPLNWIMQKTLYSPLLWPCHHPTSPPPSTLSIAARRILLKCRLGFITLLLKTLQGSPLLPTKSQSPGNVHKAQNDLVPLIPGSYLLLFFLLLCSRYTELLAVSQAWQMCSCCRTFVVIFPSA